jgi:hypothetical protein
MATGQESRLRAPRGIKGEREREDLSFLFET